MKIALTGIGQAGTNVVASILTNIGAEDVSLDGVDISAASLKEAGVVYNGLQNTLDRFDAYALSDSADVFETSIPHDIFINAVPFNHVASASENALTYLDPSVTHVVLASVYGAHNNFIA